MSKVLNDFRRGVLECLMVPNNLLPESYQNKKEGFVSLRKLDRKSGEKKRKEKVRKEKAAKEKIENAAKQQRLASYVPTLRGIDPELMDGPQVPYYVDNMTEIRIERNAASFITMLLEPYSHEEIIRMANGE